MFCFFILLPNYLNFKHLLVFKI